MEIHICQTCGTVLPAQKNQCTGCGSFVSMKAATALPVMSITDAPVTLHAHAQPAVDLTVGPENKIQEFPTALEPLRNSFYVLPPAPPVKTASERIGSEEKFDPEGKAASEKGYARALAAVAGLFILVIGIMIGVEISNTLHERQPAPSTTPPTVPATTIPAISGLYDLEYTTPHEPHGVSHLEIKQKEDTFTADGTDAGLPWHIDGRINPPSGIRFTKHFLLNGRPLLPAVEFTGTYQLDDLERAYMSGSLEYSSRPGGVLTKLKPNTVRGNFTLRPLSAKPPPSPPPPQGSSNLLDLLAKFNKGLLTPKAVSELFLNLSALLIGIGLLLTLFALKIFSPSGKLNILAKQEYIPSQYKSQHNKMVREWSGSLKPGGVPLGTRTEWRAWKPWQAKTLAIPPDERRINPHLLVIGGTDKGKTRFVANMIAHDIESADRAVAVIDSDGQLSELTMRWIAAHPKGAQMAERVVLIDPTSKTGSPSYNPLEEPVDGNMMDAASSVVHGFKAVYTEPPGSQSQWNQQTANILRNAAVLLMANKRTLTDLPTLLQDNDFRDILLEGVEKKKNARVEYITLLETWRQYKRLARSDQWITWSEPILNRLTPMLSDPRIRPILTSPVGDLNLREVILNKQILIIRIPQGQLNQNANLLGSLLITGLKQAALSLSESPSASAPRQIALYMDELNNFIEKETVEALTQETSRFQIGLTGTVKTLQHLPEDFRSNLLIQMGTICAFTLSKKDADMFGPQMFRVDGRKIKHQTIQNFFNKVNTSPQFELISDEEKLNIDRLVGQEVRHFYCYKVGTVAGTFRLKTHAFNNIADGKVKPEVMARIKRSAR